MTDGSQKTLLDLQKIDAEIQQADRRKQEYGPQLEEVGETVTRLEGELEQARNRLNELTLDERRLESAARDKKARLDKLQERLNSVRNLREEAAVHAEADLVRRAMEADEHEALSVLDLIKRAEERIGELERDFESAQAEVAPRRTELLHQLGHCEHLGTIGIVGLESCSFGRERLLAPQTIRGCEQRCADGLGLRHPRSLERP